MSLDVERVGPEATDAVLAVIVAAFGARPQLDPPADAAAETAETLRARLTSGGALLARLDRAPAGALALEPDGPSLHLRRFGVVPHMQGRGVAQALVEAATRAAEAGGYYDVAVTARAELPETIRFWEHQGFAVVRRTGPVVELSRPLGAEVVDVPDADSMRRLGEAAAARLRAGDVVLLSGQLGAGKTTFTQGLGRGLSVRGDVTSPTFVIARVHPSEVGGPALVHVDAYRLGSLAELDDLDLDAALEDAVTVVEWGGGLAEGLAESRLDVRIGRADEPAEGPLDPRRVQITDRLVAR